MATLEDKRNRRYDRVIQEWGLAPVDAAPSKPRNPIKPRSPSPPLGYRRKMDDDTFVRMVEAGSTPKQIAIDLGVSRQAVSQRAKALGLQDRLRENKPAPKGKQPRARKDRYGLPWEIIGPLMERGAVRAFRQQRASAGQRGIGWELSFVQWWAIWEPHYDKRGRGKDQLVMCRTADKGPYAVGNVRIDSPKGNMQEAALERLTRKGRKMRSRQYVPFAPGSIVSRHGVFREYREDEETA